MMMISGKTLKALQKCTGKLQRLQRICIRRNEIAATNSYIYVRISFNDELSDHPLFISDEYLRGISASKIVSIDELIANSEDGGDFPKVDVINIMKPKSGEDSSTEPILYDAKLFSKVANVFIACGSDFKFHQADGKPAYLIGGTDCFAIEALIMPKRG